MTGAVGCHQCEAFGFWTTADTRGVADVPCEVTLSHDNRTVQLVVASYRGRGGVASPSQHAPLGQCGAVALGGNAGYTSDPSLVPVSVTPDYGELEALRDSGCMAINGGGAALGSALGFSGSGYFWSVDVSVLCGSTMVYPKTSVSVCGGPE